MSFFFDEIPPVPSPHLPAPIVIVIAPGGGVPPHHYDYAYHGYSPDPNYHRTPNNYSGGIFLAMLIAGLLLGFNYIVQTPPQHHAINLEESRSHSAPPQTYP